VLRDEGSTHGTKLNDEAVAEKPLRDGDYITIGQTTFRFHLDPDAVPTLLVADIEATMVVPEEEQAPVAEGAPAPPRPGLFCTNCGAALTEEDRFCGDCGTPRENIASTPTPVRPPTAPAQHPAPPAAQAAAPPQVPVSPAARSSTLRTLLARVPKKWVLLGGVGLLAVIILAVLLNMLGGLLDSSGSGGVVPSEGFRIQALNPETQEDLPSLYESIIYIDERSTDSYSRYDGTGGVNQPASFYLGWCARDETTLFDNMDAIRFELRVDGQSVPIESLHLDVTSDGESVCQSYLGVLTWLETGQHRFEWLTHRDAPIYDGWESYEAGTETIEMFFDVSG
jgi:hypothetical protein